MTIFIPLCLSISAIAIYLIFRPTKAEPSPAVHRCHFRKLSDPFWKEKNIYYCNVCGSYYGKKQHGWKMIDRRDNANRP